MKLFAVAPLLLTMAGCSNLDVVESHYATATEARKEQAFGDWIPAFVPSNAYNIHDVHNNDTISQTLTFAASPDALQAMVKRMTPVVVDSRQKTRAFAACLGWGQLLEQSSDAYIARSPSGILFLDRKGVRVLFRRGYDERLGDHCRNKRSLCLLSIKTCLWVQAQRSAMGKAHVVGRR